ncbi:MAG: hypothetical protein A2W91_20155 [Bacteroidetes bacterium GWF2_38_335]|nr:MAG: hypothetical protein A2W91_20155 [Bacteroidetes bacterium GWF2_38_335]HBS86535.1 hypothetical protein [Bacteroidales bacterium]
MLISNSTYSFDDYQNICISSDFDGIDDPLNLFASPRMYPIMVLYIANRLKWDLYRRFCLKSNSEISNDPWYAEGNKSINPERGQSLIVDEGAFLRLDYFKYLADNNDIGQINSDFDLLVKEILSQILDRNYLKMITKAKGWV